MSSPSLSDSPGTFKVDCNVAGAFLETRGVSEGGAYRGLGPPINFSDEYIHCLFYYLPKINHLVINLNALHSKR